MTITITAPEGHEMTTVAAIIAEALGQAGIRHEVYDTNPEQLTGSVGYVIRRAEQDPVRVVVQRDMEIM